MSLVRAEGSFYGAVSVGRFAGKKCGSRVIVPILLAGNPGTLLYISNEPLMARGDNDVRSRLRFECPD